MPIKTNLNRPPYWADFDPKDDYYEVLFKPSVSVQMRELNNLQTMMQTQIERFGDNVFASGTIVSGCNFQFYTPYPYIKLPDIQSGGEPVVPSNYLGKFVQDNISGLKGFVVNYADGYELSTPNLKTLYINYINSGNDSNTASFIPGNNVTVYDGSYPVNTIDVINGGAGFANTDQVVISPVLQVNVATGVFVDTDYLVNPITGANVEIVTVDTTTAPGKILLTVKPRAVDLVDSSVNSASWTFGLYDSVTNQVGSAAGVIEYIFGENAQAKVVTNSTGTVQQVPVISGGSGYTQDPTATIKTANNTAVIANLILSPRNFVARFKIPSIAEAVGNGYAFGVTEGVVFQQGFFLRVNDQTVIVSKYSQTPNNVSVGFATEESIVTAQEDDNLYEIATGEPNEFAPGADRLKLVPELMILTKEEAVTNDHFLTLVEWNDGFPYKQNQVTQYSQLGDAMGALVYDSSGNFVLDAFQVTTESVANASLEGTYYTAVIDPGQGYINGKKVQTTSNYKIDMVKGLDTKIANNISTISYGNYVRVQQLAGNFDFSGGDTVDLYDTAANYFSNAAVITAGVINPQGTKLGTARIRSCELESGYPGTFSAVHRLYLFDLQMNPGQNFRKVKSLYYNSTYKGIADIILEFDASTSANVAVIHDTNQDALLFYSGVESLKNSNATNYIYRTIDTVNTVINTAKTTITLTDVNEFFPYDGDLAISQMQELLVIPVEADIECTNAAGNVAVVATSNIIIGTSTTFDTDYAVGDYIKLTDNAANNNLRQITAVANATSLQVRSLPTFTLGSVDHKRVFPKNLPIPFGQRPGLYANVDVTEKVLSLQFRHSNNQVMTLAYAQPEIDTKVAYNVERRNVTSASKTAHRGMYVKIRMSDGGTDGPWSLGVPDAFRLRAVYVGNSTVNSSSSDITTNFYIDHNQNPNYMGLSYLYIKSRSGIVLQQTDYLLCCFDYFTRDNPGYFDTVSYRHTANTTDLATLESLSFSNLSSSTAAISWEIPEVFTSQGNYYDLSNCFDFRPTAANTAAPATTPASAPINPSETVTLSAFSKFPRPNAVMKTQIEQYLGRLDDIYISLTGSIYILKGPPDVNPRNRYQSNHPKDSLRLQTLIVPPYPNICTTTNVGVRVRAETGIGNEKFLNLRNKTHQITAFLTTTNQQTSQPMVYTMEDIAQLERRIKDLEYYVSLSVLETNITNKIIPSSIDPSLDRFKFGFFADDFSTMIYCDTDNPQYAASIEVEGSDDIQFGTDSNPFTQNTAGSAQSNAVGTDISQPTSIILQPTNRLVPPKRVWALKHFTENPFYVDQMIMRQMNATYKVNPCVVDVGQYGTTYQPGNAYYSSINRNQSAVYFEDLAGLVSIYFDILPGPQNDGGKITVYNANNQIIAGTDVAHNAVKELTATDVTFLTTSPLANDFYHGVITSNFTNKFHRDTGTGFQDWGIGSGKIQIPSNGGKIVLVANSFDVTPNAKYLVEYPSLLSANKLIVNTPQCNPNPPKYLGSLDSAPFTIGCWACSNIFRTNAGGYKAFIIIATGLIPNTIHEFYLDTKVWNYRLALIAGGNTYEDFAIQGQNGRWHFTGEMTSDVRDNLLDYAPGKVLKSDKSGKLVFMVFFPTDIAGWFSRDFNAPGYDGDVINNTSATPGKAKFYTPTYGSSGYTSLIVQDKSGQSQAARVFANRTPNKTIPADNRGNI